MLVTVSQLLPVSVPLPPLRVSFSTPNRTYLNY